MFAYCLNNPVNESDENGYFLSWLIGFIVAAVVVAVANTAVQLGSDLINYAITGQWNSGWEDYVGAFLGGLAGGAVFFLTGFNAQFAFGTIGFVETLSTNLLTNATGKTDDSILSIIGKSLASGLFNLILGKGFNKVPGITKGINSYMAVFKSGLTKLSHGTARKMSIKVITKGIFGSFIFRGAGVLSGFLRGLTSQLKKLII